MTPISPTCPNCGKSIELVGPADLKDEYGISANVLQHEREKGRLPEPWINLNNRNLYLRSDIQGFVSDRGRARVENTVRDLMAALQTLPDGEREEALKLIKSEAK